MNFTANKLLLFGATGDLSQRMLLPSLCALHSEKLLPEGMQIICTARTEYTDDEFRQFAREALAKFLPKGRDLEIEPFLQCLSYQDLDASTPEGFDALAQKVGPIGGGEKEGLSIFLSTAPFLFEPTIKGLSANGLATGNVRIGLEKPLGTDLGTSQEINDAVASAFPENRIFPISEPPKDANSRIFAVFQ